MENFIHRGKSIIYSQYEIIIYLIIVILNMFFAKVSHQSKVCIKRDNELD